VIDFAHPADYGYVRNRRQVAGFQPHHLTRMPRPFGESWTIQNLQLVSLLKHAEPAVYVSENLPRMKELHAVPTRKLAPWEAEMLTDLQQGAELRILAGPEQIHMLGAIRAARPCLACHAVQHGQLLGAFSYLLRKE
jgi:hypothetical protein